MKKSIVMFALLGAAFAQPSLAWDKCGVHNGICKNSGKAVARYGYSDGQTENWSQIDIKGDVDCVPELFKDGTVTGDPFGAGIADVDKWCAKQ